MPGSRLATARAETKAGVATDGQSGPPDATPTERVGDDVTMSPPPDQAAAPGAGPATWVTGAIIVAVLVLLVLVVALVVD